MKRLILSLLFFASITAYSQAPPLEVDLVVSLTPNRYGAFDIVVDTGEEVNTLNVTLTSIVKAIKTYEGQGYTLVYITESSSIRLFFKETENEG